MNSEQKFLRVAETGSTNQDLLDAARSGALSPAALLTDHQVSGRGRMGRAWHNDRPDGGGVRSMLGSIRQDWDPGHPSLPLMPLAVGLAVHAACERWVDDPGTIRLKWPNDVVVENPRFSGASDESWFLKLSGVLVETVPLSDSDRIAVVAGAGINLHPVASADPLVRSTSVSMSELCTRVPSNVELFECLLVEFDRWTRRLVEDAPGLVESYRVHCETVGHRVRIDSGTDTSFERAVGIADDGALVVESDDGSTSTITYGDVSITHPD